MGSQEKLQTGTVVSTKMDKTVVVRIDRSKRHRLYGKTLRVTRRYKAHDEKNECNLGDLVRIAETRPLSREKRWRVVEIVQKGDVAEVAPREIGARILEETRAEAEAEAEARRAEEAARRAALEPEDVAPDIETPAEAGEPEAPAAEADAESVREGADDTPSMEAGIADQQAPLDEADAADETGEEERS
jgi:small subunit ribosomal protein S17